MYAGWPSLLSTWTSARTPMRDKSPRERSLGCAGSSLPLRLVHLAFSPYSTGASARPRATLDKQSMTIAYPLVDGARLDQSGTHFPTLTGRYRDKPIRVDAIIDSATLRKLPSVWLQLNIVEPLPIDVTFDFLVRPLNTEFFSPAARLPLRIEYSLRAISVLELFRSGTRRSAFPLRSDQPAPSPT